MYYVDCRKIERECLLVRSGDYDRSCDHDPGFRREVCSQKKNEELKGRRIKTE
jgi:hypothetical protein